MESNILFAASLRLFHKPKIFVGPTKIFGLWDSKTNAVDGLHEDPHWDLLGKDKGFIVRRLLSKFLEVRSD